MAFAAEFGAIVMYNSWQPPPLKVWSCAMVANPPWQSTLSMLVKVVLVQYSLTIKSAGAAATPTGPAAKVGSWTALKKLWLAAYRIPANPSNAVSVRVTVVFLFMGGVSFFRSFTSGITKFFGFFGLK